MPKSIGDRPRFTRVSGPSWLYGGKPKQLFERAEINVRQESSTGDFLIRTEEGYHRRSPQLVTHRPIAGTGVARSDFTYLGVHEDVVAFTEEPGLMAALAKRQAALEADPTPTRALSYWRDVTLVAPFREMPRVAEEVLGELKKITGPGGPNDKVFAHATVHAVRAAPSLAMRIKLPSVWLRMMYDPKLANGDTGHLLKSGDTPTFAAGLSLTHGMATMEPYMAPLVAAISPSIWVMHVPKGAYYLIYSLGCPVAGTTGEVTELLQTLVTGGPSRSLPVPQVSAEAGGAAIEWWVEALNRLFAVVADPALYDGSDGHWQPIKQLQAMLTVEQLFQRTASAQAAHRDIRLRPVLLFTILDTLQRLTGRNLEVHTSLPFAESTLMCLKQLMSASAAEVLLPNAQRAVDALRETQSGFFMAEGGAVDLGGMAGGKVDLAKATSLFIKVLRDATHGHGTNRSSATARTNALLSHHTGSLPDDLGLLGYLYLLDFLANCEEHWHRFHGWP